MRQVDEAGGLAGPRGMVRLRAPRLATGRFFEVVVLRDRLVEPLGC